VNLGTMMKLYGHFVSQPARSVMWLAKLNNLPIQLSKVEPLKGDCKKADYVKKFPQGYSPGLEDGDFYLTEGASIMQYLCEKHHLSEWFPLSSSVEDMNKRAKINEYLHAHHQSTRMLSAHTFRPFMISIMDPKYEIDVSKAQSAAVKIATNFERIWLRHGRNNSNCSYIVGDTPTIADLLAYCELAQVTQMNIMSYKEFPVLEDWLQRMSGLPHHDDIHQSLLKLASLGEKMRKK